MWYHTAPPKKKKKKRNTCSVKVCQHAVQHHHHGVTLPLHQKVRTSNYIAIIQQKLTHSKSRKKKTQNLPSANGWPPSVSIFPFPKHILGEYSHCDPSTVGPSDGSRSSIHNGAAATWRLSTPRSLGILWIHRGVMKKLPLKLPILGDMRVGKQSSQGNMRSNWIISPGRGGNKK